MRSVTGQGADFLAGTRTNKVSDTSKVNVISQGNNSGNQQVNNGTKHTYVRKITDSGDVYFAKKVLITVFNIDWVFFSYNFKLHKLIFTISRAQNTWELIFDILKWFSHIRFCFLFWWFRFYCVVRVLSQSCTYHYSRLYNKVWKISMIFFV